MLTTNFVLELGELHIEQEISRQDFERWIADDIARIEQTVDQLLQRESVSVDEIDRVFLTGGSSFIPAVRSVFHGKVAPLPAIGMCACERVRSTKAVINRSVDDR